MVPPGISMRNDFLKDSRQRWKLFLDPLSIRDPPRSQDTTSSSDIGLQVRRSLDICSYYSSMRDLQWKSYTRGRVHALIDFLTEKSSNNGSPVSFSVRLRYTGGEKNRIFFCTEGFFSSLNPRNN